MKYVLGSDGVGHSFVVGFGTDPPVQCHHRAASCPDEPATCDFDNFNANVSNPQTLYGAMVGGVPACCAVYDGLLQCTDLEKLALQFAILFFLTCLIMHVLKVAWICSAASAAVS